SGNPEPPLHGRRRSKPGRVQILSEVQVSPLLVHLPAQVIRPGRPQPLPGLLQQRPSFVKMEAFAETHGLSHGRADLVAQLAPPPPRAPPRRRPPPRPGQRPPPPPLPPREGAAPPAAPAPPARRGAPRSARPAGTAEDLPRGPRRSRNAAAGPSPGTSGRSS